jgi:DNA sulfur modification protein DndE
MFKRHLFRHAALLIAACLCSTSPLRAETQLPPEQVQAIGSLVKSLIIDAATYCAPIIAMYNLRYAIAFAPTAKSKPGGIWRFGEIATPQVVRQTGYVSPNVNVVYGYGFVDLRREPVILSVPDSHGRYYMPSLRKTQKTPRALPRATAASSSLAC